MFTSEYEDLLGYCQNFIMNYATRTPLTTTTTALPTTTAAAGNNAMNQRFYGYIAVISFNIYASNHNDIDTTIHTTTCMLILIILHRPSATLGFHCNNREINENCATNRCKNKQKVI